MFLINSTWIHKNYKTMQGRKPILKFLIRDKTYETWINIKENKDGRAFCSYDEFMFQPLWKQV